MRASLLPRLVAVLLTSLVPACGTFIAYPGPALPPQSVVTLQCYARFYFVYLEECHVTAVDERRPGVGQFAGLTAEFAAGRHWVEFEVERYFGGAGGTAGVCAFEHDFAAGHRYRIIAHSFEAEVGRLRQIEGPLYVASVELRETPADGAEAGYRVPLVCASGGSLCRTTTDCAPSPGVGCRRDAGFAYGQCGVITP